MRKEIQGMYERDGDVVYKRRRESMDMWVNVKRLVYIEQGGYEKDKKGN